MLNEEELQKLEEESDIRIAGIYREYYRHTTSDRHNPSASVLASAYSITEDGSERHRLNL